MSLGKFILGVAVVGGVGLALAGGRKVVVDASNKLQLPFTVVDAYFGGAKPGDTGLPTIVLLPGEGSNPTAAFKTLEGADQYVNGWTKPVRILVPVGRYSDGNARYYVAPVPGQSRADYLNAQRQAADEVAAWLAQAVANYTSAPPKVIVVGLGANGAMAVRIALVRPDLVRQAYGTGGAVPSTWAEVPPLQGPGPAIRKISYGDGIATDAAAQAVAKDRGYDFETMTLPEPPSEATVQKWLLPQLDDGLLVP